MARLGHFARVASKNENLCSEDWCLINFFMKLSFSNKLSKTHKCEIINTRRRGTRRRPGSSSATRLLWCTFHCLFAALPPHTGLLD